MKKIFAIFAVSVIILSGCTSQKQDKEGNAINNQNNKTVSYSQNNDNTYISIDGKKYKYKLTLNGKMPNAKSESTLTVLSNDENITFDEVCRHMVGSSNESYEFMQKICIVEYN